MERIRIFNKGWNFSQDGPGNRLIYHLQGCNLYCPWCSNPEGIPLSGSMLVNSDKIQDTICPQGAIRNKQLDRTMCRDCCSRECMGKNRSEGVTYSVSIYTIDEILEEIQNAKGLFHSGGGVTITGGEPTLQFDSLKCLLQEIKKLKIHVVIETNGTSSRLPELFDLLDILIIDFKHPNSAIHKTILGMGNEQIIVNLKKASASGIPLYGEASNGIGFRILSIQKLPFEKMCGGYASHFGIDPKYFPEATMEEKGMAFYQKVIQPLFFANSEKVNPFYLYVNVNTPDILRKVLSDPKKYAPSGVYIMRIHGTFVNFLDLSPAIQNDIILRLDLESTKI
jgi:pyruvate-formate lyase-activating enzyme